MKGLEAWWHSLPTWGKILVGVGGAFLVYMLVKGKGSSSATNTVATTPTVPTNTTGSDVSSGQDTGSGYSSGSGADGYSWLGTSSGSGGTGNNNPGAQTGVGSGIAPTPVTVKPYVPATPTAPATPAQIVIPATPATDTTPSIPASVIQASQTPTDITVGNQYHSTVVTTGLQSVNNVQKSQIAATPHTNIVDNNHSYTVAQGGESYNASVDAAGGQQLKASNGVSSFYHGDYVGGVFHGTLKPGQAAPANLPGGHKVTVTGNTFTISPIVNPK